MTTDLQTWAAAEAPLVDLVREMAIMRDTEFRVSRSDWEAVWRNWMRRKQEELEERSSVAARLSSKYRHSDPRISEKGLYNLASTQEALRIIGATDESPGFQDVLFGPRSGG